MTFVVLFLLNAVLSFALSLIVAGLIGPEAFGRYALALSVSIVVATALFEWLRLSATRFDADAGRDPGIRSTLDLAYLLLSCSLAGAALVAWAAGDGFGLGGMLLAAALAAALALGWFDYAVARARARFLDGTVAALLSVRGLAGFALAVGLALAFGDPALILAGSALAAFIAIAVVRGRLADGDMGVAPARRALLAGFARYGGPVVVAGALFQAMPLVSRMVLASRSGFDEAGYVSLAGEIATRLFQNLGAALDLALFQLALRTEASAGPAAAERQAARNLAIVAAIVLPAAIGLSLVWPSFESLLVPEAFRGQVGASARLLIPAFAVQALILYALAPLFQLRRTTAPVTAAAAVGLAVNVALVVAWPGALAAEHVAAAQLAGMAAALATLTAFAAWAGLYLPRRDLGWTLAGCALMAGTLWPTLSFAPGPLTLALQVAIGVAVYAGLMLAFDVAGMRSLVRRLRP